jgi:hypothetical protein
MRIPARRTYQHQLAVIAAGRERRTASAGSALPLRTLGLHPTTGGVHEASNLIAAWDPLSPTPPVLAADQIRCSI